MKSFAGGAATNSVGVADEVSAAWNQIVSESALNLDAGTTWAVAEYDESGKYDGCPN